MVTTQLAVANVSNVTKLSTPLVTKAICKTLRLLWAHGSVDHRDDPKSR